MVILLAANVVQRSVGFGRGILFCRWLSPDELGTWEMAYSFLLLAAPVVVLGLPGSFALFGAIPAAGAAPHVSPPGLDLDGIADAHRRQCDCHCRSTVFGADLWTRDERGLVLLLAASLVAVIVHHYLEAVFAALRKFSIVSTMHFAQSLLFAAISLGLLWGWRFAAESIVIGYGAACLLSIVGTLAWKGRALAHEAGPDDGVPHQSFGHH